MATTVSAKGRVALPKKIREALQLAPGDRVEFELNGRGEIVIHKAPRAAHVRTATQVRRRAQELFALLRGLD
jgi:AbrB family looped-hinge helix DNA binding protein